MQIYISERGKKYYTGQILMHCDIYGNVIELVKINKFIIHKRKKDKKIKYITVNMQSLERNSIKYTINVDNLKYYKNTKGKGED